MPVIFMTQAEVIIAKSWPVKHIFTLSFEYLLFRNESVDPDFYYLILVGMLKQLLLKRNFLLILKILWEGLRATLIFRTFDSALNPLPHSFNFVKVDSWETDNNWTKNGKMELVCKSCRYGYL